MTPHATTCSIPLASGFAENVAIGGRPRTWPCGVAVAAAEVAVRGGCALGKATVRPSGFWPYCTGWNNLEARVRARTPSITKAQDAGPEGSEGPPLRGRVQREETSNRGVGNLTVGSGEVRTTPGTQKWELYPHAGVTEV